MVDESEIGTRFQMLSPFLNERTRRLAAAAEAATIGRGGISRVVSGHGRLAACDPFGPGSIAVPDDLRRRSHPSDRRRTPQDRGD